MREKIGMAMIIIGVLMWPVGFALKRTLLPWINPVPHILTAHLLFMIPGAYLKGGRLFKKRS